MNDELSGRVVNRILFERQDYDNAVGVAFKFAGRRVFMQLHEGMTCGQVAASLRVMADHLETDAMPPAPPLSFGMEIPINWQQIAEYCKL